MGVSVKRADVLNDFRRDYGDRRGYVCIGHVRDRDPVTKKGTWGQDFFRYPDQASDAASRVVELVKAGRDVYKPTSLCESESRSGPTVASNVISFEVDELADAEAATDLLRAVSATITDSGTEGHFHVRVMLDRDLDHDELKDLGARLYRKLGVVDGGKVEPNGMLRIAGTYSFKHDPPRPVTTGKTRTNTTVEALSVILADVPSQWQADSGGTIDIAPMDLGALPVKARTAIRKAYDQVRSARDVSEGFWGLWKECARQGVPIEQARGYDPDDLMPTRWTEESRDEQVRNAYAAAEKDSTTPRGQRDVAHEKGNKGVPAEKNTKTGLSKKRKVWGYSDLMDTRFDPMKFTVRGLIAPGATLLIGAPKVGKSFWLLNLVLAVASGREAFGHFETRLTGVLYLYLEGGGARSIQRRIVSQADDPNQDLPLQFAPEWESYEDGGIDALDDWLSDNPDIGLVVIDTLAAFRGGGTSEKNPWKADYNVLSELSALGHKHDAAIVVAHHDKKGEETDFVNSASGTKGLSAACDGIVKLERERNSVAGKMMFVGRELEDNFWDIEYSGQNWQVIGAPPLRKGAETLAAVMEFVGKRHVSMADIVEALAEPKGPYKAGTIRQCVHRAKKAKRPRLVQDGDGRYYRP